MAEKTRIIFLWHMHQPYYRKAKAGNYFLPWVRLHAVKDYYGFARLFSNFSLKANFNFSGVLLSQIYDYAVNNAGDDYLELSKIPARDLSGRQKKFIIERFFTVNPRQMIEPYRRYRQLYSKYLNRDFKSFSPQDIFDLQVYFNLVWFHGLTIKQDKNLRAIIKKGRDFNSSDKEYIFAKQYEVIKKIIPLYSSLARAGRIEISITPYYHPILPLVCDTDIVKEFSYLKVPAARFSYPQEAVWHIEQAVEEAEKVFGVKPQGSWPSEGSVSEEVIRIYSRQGFNWVMTDEDILFKSLASFNVPLDLMQRQRHIIYQPYKFSGVNILFRDRNLSDAIGFNYHHWPDQKNAALDLISHFKRINDYAGKIYKNRAVVIAMDGENAWEYYPDNGREFLETLYSGIEKQPFIKSSTAAEFINSCSVKNLQRLAPGSWINGDFGVWAGSGLNNRNWELLAKIKKALDRKKLPDKQQEKARHFLRIIEGSDWNWWNTFEDKNKDFFNIFASYVRELSRILGLKINL